MVIANYIEDDIMLKKIITSAFSFILLCFLFSSTSFAAVTCSSCTTAGCSCTISECASGLIDVFSGDCSESPIQSYTFTEGAFQWQPTTTGTYYLKALCNDGITQSVCISITVSASQDNVRPTYSSGSINSTLAGNATQFNLTMNDEISLQTSGKYIFGFDNCTGKFVNDSAVSFTATPQKVSIVKIISSTVGCTIRWFLNFTDNAGNKNESLVSNPFSFITATTTISSDSTFCIQSSDCIYISGCDFCENANYFNSHPKIPCPVKINPTGNDCVCQNNQCVVATTTTLPGGGEQGNGQGGTENLPPSITLTNPIDKSSIKSPFTITFAVKDDVGIDKNSLKYELKNLNLNYKTGTMRITSNYYTGSCQNANEACNVIIPNVNVQIGNNYYLSIYATDTAAQPKTRNMTIVFNILGYTTSTTTTTTLPHGATTTTQPREGGTNYLLIIIVILILLAVLAAAAYYFVLRSKPARTFEELYKKWGRKKFATG